MNKKQKDEQSDFDENQVSKSARKREMSALQAVGEELVKVSESKIKSLMLSETLEEALLTAKRIKSREGLRRQLQFIGKLMRAEPEENTTRAQNLLDQSNKESALHREQFHKSEKWRDTLIASPEKLEDFLQSFPNADRQWFRQSLRQYQTDLKKQKPSSIPKKMFREIQQLIAEED